MLVGKFLDLAVFLQICRCHVLYVVINRLTRLAKRSWIPRLETYYHDLAVVLDLGGPDLHEFHGHWPGVVVRHDP